MAKLFPNKLLGLLGCVAVLITFQGLATRASTRISPEQATAQAPATPASPQAATGEKAADTQSKASDQSKPYEEAEYRTFPKVGSRVAIWAVAQLHLLFAAFVLAVPIFAFIIEVIGYKTGDLRYDRLAYEFTKLLSVSFSLTATFGAALTFMVAPQPNDPKVLELKVEPGELVVQPGEHAQLKVEARWSDGSWEQVTQRVLYESTQDTVAEVSREGAVSVNQSGGATIILRYSGQSAAVPVLAPFDAPASADLPRANNFIDEAMRRQWQQLRLQPASLGGDHDAAR